MLTPTPPKVHRPYNSHLEKLGGSETVPGKILEMLRQETLQTEGGYVDEGGVFLTFRLWGLAGLNVREDNGELYTQFWPSTALGTNTRSDEARKVFQTVFDPAKNREHFYKTGKYHFFFRPIKSNSRLEEGKRLLQLLELVYEKLHKVK